MNRDWWPTEPTIVGGRMIFKSKERFGFDAALCQILDWYMRDCENDARHISEVWQQFANGKEIVGRAKCRHL